MIKTLNTDQRLVGLLIKSVGLQSDDIQLIAAAGRAEGGNIVPIAEHNSAASLRVKLTMPSRAISSRTGGNASYRGRRVSITLIVMVATTA